MQYFSKSARGGTDLKIQEDDIIVLFLRRSDSFSSILSRIQDLVPEFGQNLRWPSAGQLCERVWEDERTHFGADTPIDRIVIHKQDRQWIPLQPPTSASVCLYPTKPAPSGTHLRRILINSRSRIRPPLLPLLPLSLRRVIHRIEQGRGLDRLGDDLGGGVGDFVLEGGAVYEFGEVDDL